METLHITESTPSGDAVEVAEDLDLGQLDELFPGEGDLLVDEAEEFEAPLGHVDVRGAAGVEDGPFAGAAGRAGHVERGGCRG